MPLKIALINPPFRKNYSRQSRSPCVAKSGTIYFSYYLAYAGCSLEHNKHTVKFLDAIVSESTTEDIVDELKIFNPQLIIIDTSTPSIISDILFASSLRAAYPNSYIVAVGTFPSKNTQEFFDLVTKHAPESFNACLLGEYEESSSDLANNLYNDSLSTIDGLAYIEKSGNLIINGSLRKTSKEYLDELPFVSEFYLKHLGEEGIKRHFYASITWPYIQILTSRGCPFKCSFCNIPSIGSYRTRSIDSVINELRFISEKLPFVKEIFIEDDTFPINRKRTIDLCKRIVEEKINIRWSCNARVDTDFESLEWMKKAGCRLTCVGFESPAKDALNGTIKKTNVEQQEGYMEMASKIGIKVNGCFIIGLHGDTRESIKETVQYSKKLMPNTAQFYPHMVYPGTGSFEWAESNNLLEHKDWSKWNTPEGFHNTPLRLNGLSSQDLLELADDARREFYMNPKYLIKMFVQSLTSFSEFQRMLIAGRSFFPLLFSYFIKGKK